MYYLGVVLGVTDGVVCLVSGTSSLAILQHKQCCQPLFQQLIVCLRQNFNSVISHAYPTPVSDV